MRLRKIQLKVFRRFDDLTIDLGTTPKKIIALVGPNGCGKSSIFDAFEAKLKDFRNHGSDENRIGVQVIDLASQATALIFKIRATAAE